MTGRAPVPVTLVAGFLGAGKTTLVNHVLRVAGGRRIGVVVNDFGDLDVDAQLILEQTDDVLSLTNGCICCSMRSGVMDVMFRLSERPEPLDHVVVEASGASDPGSLVEAFRELQRMGVLRFDGLVTVVDADQVRFGSDSVGQLAKRQVRGADLVVLNKTDLVADLEDVQAQLQRLAPEARVVETTHGQVPLDVLLGLDPGDPRDPEQSDHPNVHGAEGHVQFVTSTWSFERPVPYRRFFDALFELPPTVLRAKGFLQLEERPHQRVVAHLVGRRLYAQPAGEWGSAPAVSRLVLIGTFSEAEAVELGAHLDRAARGD